MVALTVGAVVGAGLLAPSSGTPDRALAWLLFVGSSVHLAATGWLFSFRDVRVVAAEHPARFVLAPVGLILAGALCAGVVSPAHLVWVLLAFFVWQFHHFQKQNVGVVALAAMGARLPGLARGERHSILAAGTCGIAALVMRPAVLQLPLGSVSAKAFDAATVAYALSAVAGLALLARRPPAARTPAFCALLVTALAFPLPVFVFRSPYAAVGGMTIAHGLQYLVLVGLVAAGAGASPGRRAVVSLAGVAVAGGVLLSALSHLHTAGSAGVRALFGVYLGLSVVHFVADAGLWRLRDPSVRRYLGARIPALVPTASRCPDLDVDIRPRHPPVADRSVADIA
jgi:hypothetical protein